MRNMRAHTHVLAQYQHKATMCNYQQENKVSYDLHLNSSKNLWFLKTFLNE